MISAMSAPSADLPVIYTVACEFTDPGVGDEWIAWMQREHLREVLDSGALRATVMRVDRQHYEIHYRFKNRAAYDQYIADHAQRLRDDGLRAFPLERGLKYSRHVADVVEVMEK
jgi:hypothetical protein